MTSKLEILFIDDEYRNWLPILEPIGDSLGFHLTPACSVEEGLELLQKYQGMFDAVILDLVFPTTLQGKDGLLRIGKMDPFLPVLILTGSSSATDIRTAVECVRLGAYDYFPKNTLDANQLYIQARNAIEQSRRYRQRIIFADTALRKLNKPYLHVAKSDKGGFIASFAFRLDAIGAPRNKDEQKAAIDLAIDWHRNFFTYLSYSNSNIRITLRYIFWPPQRTEKPRVHAVLLFSVEETTNEETVKKADLLSKELSVYLQPNFLTPSSVYAFLPVTSEDDLLLMLNPLTPRAAACFVRKPIQRKKSNIGFGSVARTDNALAPETIFLPSFLGQNAFATLTNFCSNMLKQDSATVLDFSLTPTKLLSSEMNVLRDLRERKALEQIDLPADKVDQLVQHSARMLEQAAHCFLAEVSVMQESSEIPRPLLVSIASDFFGDSSNIEIQNAVGKTLGTYADENRLRNLFIVEEAVNIFHFPLPVIGKMPGIPTTHPAYEFVPENIPTSGPFLGIKRLGDHERPIIIAPEDLRRHVYILGQTGTGKTTLLYSMIRERLETGSGIGLIDPHGDLWNEVYSSIPGERFDDVVVFDPTVPKNAPGLNMLEYDPRFPEQKTFLIHEMFNIFWQFYDFNQTAGPMFEYYMRNGMLLVMDDPDDPGTLPDVVKVFQDDEYRRELIEKCNDKDVRDFWVEEAEKAGGEASLRNMSPYITSKLNMFIQNHYVRPIIEKKRSEINFRDIIDNKKILLVKLTKGKLGELGVKVFGTMLFARLLMAALSRENIPEKQREDFTLFVDEFQNFTSDTIVSALSEGRKYRLNLVLANQTLGQLREQILTSVLGNVGSLIFFRPGVEDIGRIEPYVSPPFTREEMLNLENFKAVARLQVNNAPTPPFMFETLPLEVLKQK